VRIEECRPISKRKSWLVVVRNGEAVARPEGFSAPEVVTAAMSAPVADTSAEAASGGAQG
jgi:small subunit ribosomal protein S17